MRRTGRAKASLSAARGFPPDYIQVDIFGLPLPVLNGGKGATHKSGL